MEPMNKRMLLCSVIFAIAVIRCGVAFPQIDDWTFQADGFVFDGPASRPMPTLTDGRSSTTDENSSKAQTTTQMTRTTTSATTPPSDPEYDNCVTECLATPEYNPVCGSDKVNYDNPGRLRCANVCGKDVTLQHYGRCSISRIRGR